MSVHYEELLRTITTLRAPGGCPWDRKQKLSDAARYLLDEAAELLEATLAEDYDNVQEELGDLLFMTCFCCEILSDKVSVQMDDIARLGNEKLIRRHPAVFGAEQSTECTDTSQQHWDAIKAQEKVDKGIDITNQSILKDMPAATAPLHQAYNYQKNASDSGFDWPDVSGVWAKLSEELDELRAAISSGDAAAIEHELGDLLFSVVNIARWLKIQPDLALRKANNRFRDRFHLVEQQYKQENRLLKDASIEELEAAWQLAKSKLANNELANEASHIADTKPEVQES